MLGFLREPVGNLLKCVGFIPKPSVYFAEKDAYIQVKTRHLKGNNFQDKIIEVSHFICPSVSLLAGDFGFYNEFWFWFTGTCFASP